jgi:hypothetical protein
MKIFTPTIAIQTGPTTMTGTKTVFIGGVTIELEDIEKCILRCVLIEPEELLALKDRAVTDKKFLNEYHHIHVP